MPTMSQPNLLRYVIEQATRGGKSVVSRRKFSSSHCKFDERERSVLMDKMKSSTNRRRLLAFLVASSLSFHLWEFTRRQNARHEAKKMQLDPKS